MKDTCLLCSYWTRFFVFFCRSSLGLARERNELWEDLQLATSKLWEEDRLPSWFPNFHVLINDRHDPFFVLLLPGL
jgi:hypothetical protein